jgi:hypothetical protein
LPPVFLRICNIRIDFEFVETASSGVVSIHMETHILGWYWRGQGHFFILGRKREIHSPFIDNHLFDPKRTCCSISKEPLNVTTLHAVGAVQFHDIAVNDRAWRKGIAKPSLIMVRSSCGIASGDFHDFGRGAIGASSGICNATAGAGGTISR